MKKGEKLEFLIKTTYPNLSNRKFAELAEIPPTTLQGIFNRGIDSANLKIVKKIAHALNMTLDELDEIMHQFDLIMHEEQEEQIFEIENKKTTRIYEFANKSHSFKMIDYFGDVSAGIPTTVEGIENAKKIAFPKKLLGKYANKDDIFAVKVNGESMNKIIPHDSIAICTPVNTINDIKNEDIVIFTKGNETSMKRFFSTDTEIIFSPESTMRCFYDVVIDKDTVDEVVVNAKVISYHAFLD